MSRLCRNGHFRATHDPTAAGDDDRANELDSAISGAAELDSARARRAAKLASACAE
jgi:hypothetical protein